MQIKLVKKSEWLSFPKPFGEPEEEWPESYGEYWIERIVNEDGATIWFGCSVNWKKEKNGNWTVLSKNEDVKPLEKYLPEIVYGEDRWFWKECEEPIYEKLYKSLEF